MCGKKKIKLGYVSTNGSAPSMRMDDNHQIDRPHNVNGFHGKDVMEREKQLRDMQF